MSDNLLTQRVNTYFAILIIVIFGAVCALILARVARNSYTELGLGALSQNATAL